MTTLRNFTLHTQGPAEIEIAARAGFDLTPRPEGIEIAPATPLDGPAARFAASLRDAARAGHAVLIGGHTGLWIAALLLIPPNELPRLFYFETRRTRDENGRFVFIPERLGEVPVPPRSIVE